MRLPCDPASPRRARQYVRGALHEKGKDDLREVASLLVSELVTNAYLHARSDVELRVACSPRDVTVAVSDTSPAPAKVRPSATARVANGHGLQLVDALADDWGNDIDGDGKTVWFSLTDGTADSAASH